jgi:hypothetical protein
MVARSQRRCMTIALGEAIGVVAGMPGGDAVLPLRQLLGETPDSRQVQLFHPAKTGSWPVLRSSL